MIILLLLLLACIPTKASAVARSAFYSDTGQLIPLEASDAKTALSLVTANQLSVYATGTAYSLTATPTALDFGTIDPSLTITAAGTYLIIARAHAYYNGATFAASRLETLKLRRTNNTAADLTSGGVADLTGIVTTTSGSFMDQTWSVIYTTTNTNDAITIFGDVGVVPTAGSLDITNASIVAIRIQQ